MGRDESRLHLNVFEFRRLGIRHRHLPYHTIPWYGMVWYGMVWCICITPKNPRPPPTKWIVSQVRRLLFSRANVIITRNQGFRTAHVADERTRGIASPQILGRRRSQRGPKEERSEVLFEAPYKADRNRTVSQYLPARSWIPSGARNYQTRLRKMGSTW